MSAQTNGRNHLALMVAEIISSGEGGVANGGVEKCTRPLRKNDAINNAEPEAAIKFS